MIQFTPANLPSVFSFILIVSSVIAMLLLGSLRINKELTKKLTVFLLVWLGATSVVVASGVLKEHLIPLAPLFFLSINICAIWFAYSKFGAAFTALPVMSLVLFQCFRLPLELILHSWVLQKTIPETMTWSGQNFDIISGVLALLVLIKPLRTNTFYWFFNTVGLGLLLNVMRVAMMSSPFPFSWPLENPLQLVLYMPYALIGTVCVWGALAGHLILTRALLKTKN